MATTHKTQKTQKPAATKHTPVKPAPLKLVKDLHGGHTGLVEKLLPLLDTPEGQTKDDLRRVLKRQTNKKLLTLLARKQSKRA